ncbi:MAG: hypothetical protein RLZZ126_1037 [Pseudomonadota bacterium]|jgi:peptidoglycan/xylan/chitin deacetylase (PgdA/CDA1 family)
MVRPIKTAIRSLAYRSGLLGAIHRWRNRNTLTVFMFHRVLPVDSVAYAHAEKEFTFTTDGFSRCLDFIQRHYHVVPHAAVRAHLEGRGVLPHCAGLITFDDGWRDTLVHAWPALRQRQLPGLLFLATEVPALVPDRWWQDMLVEVLAAPGRLDQLEGALALRPALGASAGARQRALTGALAALSDAQRHSLLTPFVRAPLMSRQMLVAADLSGVPPGLAVAGHGHSHAPLTAHPDPGADLEASHTSLRHMGADDGTLSFPHGDFDPTVLAQARQAGFSICYSSEPSLVDVSFGPDVRQPLGRIHVPENEWTCEGGKLSFARLATFLFFRPIAR